MYGKLNPHGILNPLISNHDIGRGLDIPNIAGQNTMGRGPIYHGQGFRNTICKGSEIPWVGGSKYHRQGALYAMCRGFNVPWTWDLIYQGQGLEIPWLRGSKYHGQGVQYTIGKVFELPWVECSIYNWQEVKIRPVH